MKNLCLAHSFHNHIRALLEAAFYGSFCDSPQSLHLPFFIYFLHVSYIIGIPDFWQHCQDIHPLRLLCFRFIKQSLEWLSNGQTSAGCSSQGQNNPQWHSHTIGRNMGTKKYLLSFSKITIQRREIQFAFHLIKIFLYRKRVGKDNQREDRIKRSDCSCLNHSWSILFI